MTIIGYDGECMWSDSQVTEGELKAAVRKVFRVRTPEGYALAGFAGETSTVGPVLNALRCGFSVEPLVNGNSTVLIATSEGCRVFSGKKSWPDTAPIFIGSGSAAARGAYAVCGDVARSVKAACAVDLYSSLPIRKVRV